MRLVEERVEAEGLQAVGFLSYEAAPAFDPAFQVRAACGFPLLWFGLFRQRREVQLPETGAAAFAIGPWAPSVARREYDTAITEIKERIARGQTYQVNYTYRLSASFSGDPRGLWQALQRVQPTAYSAYIDAGRFAICSVSPELFFELDGDRITCRPMKGTAARGLTLAEDREQAARLEASAKNRAENLMIVDMIRNDLGRLAVTGSVTVPQLFRVERHPTLWQMTSTVTASTGAGLGEIMKALFPCASITGAPKIRTMGIITGLERQPRRIYTGCIGTLSPGRRARFSVAIRTALVDREAGTAEYGVGGGIVWDSSADEEYAECQTKARLLTVGLQDREPSDFTLLEAILWTREEGWFLLPYHLRRLSESAEYFGFVFDLQQVRIRLDETAASLPPEAHKLRLALERSGQVSCQAEALSAIAKPKRARLGLAAQPVDSRDVFLYHKTSRRQVYQEARLSCPDCDEVLLWNERGEATETDTANLVVRLDGRLFTPPVACGLLAGTFRAWLLDQNQVQERVIKVTELVKCDRIYVVNSIRKWREAVPTRLQLPGDGAPPEPSEKP